MATEQYYLNSKVFVFIKLNAFVPFIYNRTIPEGRKEMFYLTTHSTHFIYGYMASDIWLKTILIVRKETRCRHIGFPINSKGSFICTISQTG